MCGCRYGHITVKVCGTEDGHEHRTRFLRRRARRTCSEAKTLSRIIDHKDDDDDGADVDLTSRGTFVRRRR